MSGVHRRFFCPDSVFIIIILVYPLLTIFQGLDMGDFGFWAVKYRDALSFDPALNLSGENGGVFPLASIYLTEIFGGVWHALFGRLGVFSFKLLFAFIAWATAWIAYKSLRPFFVARRPLLFGLALAVLAITPTMQLINYNNFPAFLYVCTAFFLLRTFRNGRAENFFFAGLCMSLTVFARIPSIAGILLFLIPLAYIRSHLGTGAMLRSFVWSFLGFIAGCVFTGVIVILLGQEEIFLNGIKATLFGDMGPYHKFSYLAKRFLSDTAKVAGTILALAAFYTLFSRLLSRRDDWRARLLPCIAAFFLVHLPMYLIEQELGNGKQLISFPLYIFAFALFLAGIILFSLPGQFLRNRWAHICLVVFGIAFLLPLGSDQVWWNAKFGLWLALPLALGTVFRAGNAQAFYFGRFSVYARALFWSILVPAWVFTAAYAFTQTDRDQANRLKLVHSLHHPNLRGIHTNKARADALNELTDYLARYDLKGKAVLIPFAPLLTYVTECIPYLGFSMPHALFSHSRLTNAFSWARGVHREYPLIIYVRAITAARNWPLPDPYAAQWLQTQWAAPRPTLHALTMELIQEGGYTEVWTNAIAAVYEPENWSRTPLDLRNPPD
ncbi:MAG: hypothetical protein LBC99_03585 [Spirochaetota bacterium]|nr:hypothetical protein [Spirochaetota bacterium]